MRIKGIGVDEFFSRLWDAGYQMSGVEDKQPTEREVLVLMAEKIEALRSELDELKAKQ